MTSPAVVTITEPHITRHAYDRARERFSLKANALKRVAGRAISSGLCRHEVSGHLRKYLDKCWLEYRKAGNMRVYGDMLLLFSGPTLITLWQLPLELRRLARACRHKQSLHACK